MNPIVTAIGPSLASGPGGGSAAAAAFSPSDLSNLVLWVEASDLSTMFQSNAGTTAVSANGDPVGTWNDKSSNAFNLTSAADDTTRPTYGTASGLHYVTFASASSQYLRRLADIGSYAAGACSAFVAIRGNPATNAKVAACGNSSVTNPIYAIIQASSATSTSSSTFLRNDAGSTIVADSGALEQTGVFDNSDHVYGITDDGSTLRSYVDGVAGDTHSYVRSGAVTLDRFAVGALLRNTAGNFFNCPRLYALVIVNRVLSSTERGNLTTYLGNKAGLTL